MLVNHFFIVSNTIVSRKADLPRVSVWVSSLRPWLEKLHYGHNKTSSCSQLETQKRDLKKNSGQTEI